MVAARPHGRQLIMRERAREPRDQAAYERADQGRVRVVDRALQLRDDVDRGGEIGGRAASVARAAGRLAHDLGKSSTRAECLRAEVSV